ncbi:MAG: GNAT family N-acetyltransferase, partial [Alphaproteobacteria bacterium]|nr:GNAT family N-acetyltransferase [Alphaproteobacteria bacterium]
MDVIFRPHVLFHLARLDDEAVGCGGIALCTGFAELKRMYVRPKVRGQGVADAIVRHLMWEAMNAGLAVLRLETGARQGRALRFNDRWGFRPCQPFAPYRSMPVATVSASVFSERSLL